MGCGLTQDFLVCNRFADLVMENVDGKELSMQIARLYPSCKTYTRDRTEAECGTGVYL